MDAVFNNRGVRPDENYYTILGCDETSSEEQIATEYKRLARKYHPDKVPQDQQADAKEKFLKIEKAKGVLLDKAKRTKYDEWRLGGFNIVLTFEKWMELQPRVHTSMHWAPPEKPRPSLPESTSNPPPSETSTTTTTSTTTEDQHSTKPPISLEEFRRGQGSSSTGLSHFRDYTF